MKALGKQIRIVFCKITSSNKKVMKVNKMIAKVKNLLS